MSTQGILVVGGSGVVGSRIAADLAIDYPNRVIVAGRRLGPATEIVRNIGQGARARQIDIMDPHSIAAALKDVGVVISCIDQPGRKLLNAAIERGLQYTDITPHLTDLGRGAAFEKIDAAARNSGARIVIGAGIVPGISSVIVRALADRLGGADEIETALMLGAADVAGPASFDYLLQELTMSFVVHVNGKDIPTRALSSPRKVEFPAPVGAQTAYLFPFSDQVLYPRTMGARTVLTRLAIEPAWLGRFLSMLVHSGITRIFTIAALRRLIAKTRRNRPSSEGAQFALRVDVKRGGRKAFATLQGRTQAEAAAAGAAGVARALIDGRVRDAGVWMPEQVIDPCLFFAHLGAKGLSVRLPKILHDEPREVVAAFG
jgi:saccharopine dehydrogenase (NAD+, L-lysine forming)